MALYLVIDHLVLIVRVQLVIFRNLNLISFRQLCEWIRIDEGNVYFGRRLLNKWLGDFRTTGVVEEYLQVVDR